MSANAASSAATISSAMVAASRRNEVELVDFKAAVRLAADEDDQTVRLAAGALRGSRATRSAWYGASSPTREQTSRSTMYAGVHPAAHQLAEIAEPRAAGARMRSAAFSPIMTTLACVFALGMV